MAPPTSERDIPEGRLASQAHGGVYQVRLVRDNGPRAVIIMMKILDPSGRARGPTGLPAPRRGNTRSRVGWRQGTSVVRPIALS